MTRTQLKPAVLLALFALWFQALLPLTHHPAGMAMAGMPSMEMGPPASGSLCMAPGAATIDPSDKAPAHKPPPCPICQTFQMLAGGFIPPSAVSVAAPEFHRLTAAIPTNENLTQQHIHFGARARAPPMRA